MVIDSLFRFIGNKLKDVYRIVYSSGRTNINSNVLVTETDASQNRAVGLYRNGHVEVQGYELDSVSYPWFRLISQAGASSYISIRNGGNLGNNMLVQAGGNLIAGGGEYPTNRHAATLVDDNREDAYFGADQDVYIESNAQTIANAKRWKFNTNGNIVFPVGTELIMSTGVAKDVTIWGNSSNKIGLAVTNTQDNKQYAILAKAGYLRLYDHTSESTVYDIYPHTLIANQANWAVGSISVASRTNNTWTNIGSRTLDPGRYIVIVTGSWTNNANGVRKMSVNTAPDIAPSMGHMWIDYRNAIVGDYTTCKIIASLQVSETTTYYVNVWQNSGSSLTFYPRTSIYKIL